MVSNLKGKILKIELGGENKYKVTLDVYDDSEIEQVLDFENENGNFIIHGNRIEFTITGNEMDPINEAKEYMQVYHSYEAPDNLNPRLRRYWYTANIIDDIADNLISNGVLKIYPLSDD